LFLSNEHQHATNIQKSPSRLRDYFYCNNINQASSLLPERDNFLSFSNKHLSAASKSKLQHTPLHRLEIKAPTNKASLLVKLGGLLVLQVQIK